MGSPLSLKDKSYFMKHFTMAKAQELFVKLLLEYFITAQFLLSIRL